MKRSAKPKQHRRTRGSLMLIRRLIAAILLIALLLLTGLVSPGFASHADCPGNALVNPGFEEGFSDRGAGEVSIAIGWFP